MQRRSIESIEVEFNEPGEDFYRFDADTLGKDRWSLSDDNTLTIKARPLAGYHVRVVLDKEAMPSQVAGINEYFGDKIMVWLDGREPSNEIIIECPASAVDAKRAWLRLAYGSLLLEPDQPAVQKRLDQLEDGQ